MGLKEEAHARTSQCRAGAHANRYGYPGTVRDRDAQPAAGDGCAQYTPQSAGLPTSAIVREGAPVRGYLSKRVDLHRDKLLLMGAEGGTDMKEPVEVEIPRRVFNAMRLP